MDENTGDPVVDLVSAVPDLDDAPLGFLVAESAAGKNTAAERILDLSATGLLEAAAFNASI